MSTVFCERKHHFENKVLLTRKVFKYFKQFLFTSYQFPAVSSGYNMGIFDTIGMMRTFGLPGLLMEVIGVGMAAC